MGVFSHLHVASGFSARYGASHPEALARSAAELGMSALALTDRDTVAGMVRHAKSCVAHGVRPLFGVDLAVAAHAAAQPARRPRTPVRGGAHVAEPLLRVTLLARSARGWARLCRLVSAAHAALVDGHPVAGWEALQEHLGEELVVLLGPASEPARALSRGRSDVAEQLLAPWQEIAGKGLRLEAVSYGLPGLGAGSVRLAAHTVALGDRLSIPVVLTNAVRYAIPEHSRLADVLDAARLLRPIPFGRSRLDPGECYLKDTAAMEEVADRIAAAAGAAPGRGRQLIEETVRVAEQCRVDPVRDLGMGRPVRELPGIGGKTAALLGEYGLHTVADVADVPQSTLQRLLGARAGRALHEHAHGRDTTVVDPTPAPARLSTERCFPRDELAPAAHRRILLALADDLGICLRATDRIATGVTCTIRYADLSATRRSRTLPEATQHTVVLARAACAVYDTLGLQRARVRSISLRADALQPADRATRQLTLDAGDDKPIAIEVGADRARARYGHRMLYLPPSLSTPDPRLSDAGAPEQRHGQ